MINASFGSEGNPNLENDLKNDKWLFSEKLTKWTCKMITQENDESVLKNQQSAQLWLIIFLGNDCSVADMKTMLVRYYEKMMQGFRAIERSFKMNCNAQIAMSEQIEDFTGELQPEMIFRV